MLRKLVAKVLRRLVKALEGEKKVLSVDEYCTVTSTSSKTRGHKVHDTHEKKITDLNKLEREDKTAYINQCLEDIQAELYVKGYKAMEEILTQYHIEVVQTFVLTQLVQLGQYSPEEDNLDQYTIHQLIEKASENNQLLWRQRQIEQGKAQVSQAQLDAIKNMSKKLSIQPVMPKDKFEASEIIEALSKRLGRDVNSNKPSDAQLNAINTLCKKLGKNLALAEVAVDGKTASKTIQNLQNELKEHPELDTPSLATKNQVEYVKRLLALQKKRWTEKREKQYSSMTAKDISAVIETLNAQCKEAGLIDDHASEGQVKYILSLGKLLKKNYNPEEVKALDKKQASKVIENIQREYLYFLYRGNGSQITKKEIASMSLATVRELIDQLQLERKTHFYEKNAEGYSASQKAL